jgi:hypothetical protein
VKRGGRWVPFGEGDIGRVGYFQLLREINYRAPISLHIEYDWTGLETQLTAPSSPGSCRRERARCGAGSQRADFPTVPPMATSRTFRMQIGNGMVRGPRFFAGR